MGAKHQWGSSCCGLLPRLLGRFTSIRRSSSIRTDLGLMQDKRQLKQQATSLAAFSQFLFLRLVTGRADARKGMRYICLTSGVAKGSLYVHWRGQ